MNGANPELKKHDMGVPGFEKIKMMERHARVNGPLMEMLNERWGGCGTEDENCKKALCRYRRSARNC
jgi:hypothetical protein